MRYSDLTGGLAALYFALAATGAFAQPAISLDYTVGTEPGVCGTSTEIVVDPGTNVTLCYSATNTGTVALEVHNLQDLVLGDLLSGALVELAPGASEVVIEQRTVGNDFSGVAWWTSFVETEPYSVDDTAAYDFVDISTTGTPLGLTDDGEANVTMPFNFGFNGRYSDRLRVANNGGVLFDVDAGQLPSGNLLLPSTSFDMAILPFWDDLDDETGDVYYQTLGAAPDRQFVVQWHERPHFPGPGAGNVTFQMILIEGSNQIKFQYADVDFGDPALDNGASATVGLNFGGAAAEDAQQYSFNSSVLSDGLAILWTPTFVTGSASASVTLPAAEAAVDPTSIEVTLFQGESTSVPLELQSVGTGDLNFELLEIEGDFVPAGQAAPPVSRAGSEQSRSHEADDGSTVLPGSAPGTRGSTIASLPVGPWVTIPSSSPAVSRAAGAVVNGLFYVIGGESSGGARSGIVQVYDPVADAWDTASNPAMPTPASNLCAAAIGERIYVPGGFDGSTELTDLQVLDTASNEWETVASDPLPALRYAPACASFDGKLYVFGGFDGSVYTDTTWVYDPQADAGSRWTTLSPAPLVGGFGAAIGVGDRIFYSGINLDPGVLDSDGVFAYLPATDEWRTYPSLQTARGGAGVWAIGTTLYVGGGGWNSYLTSVESYDTEQGESGAWVDANPLVQGRRTFAYATDPINGYTYASKGWASAYLDQPERADFLVPTDVPWLSQSPVTGSIPSGESESIDVSLDAALSTIEPGSYTASILVSGVTTEDPLLVPVTMNVEALPPITGLTASNDGPVLVGQTINLAAAITGGINVSYDWDFGDGNSGSGAAPGHEYLAPGIYTATVTASNLVSSEQATTDVEVLGFYTIGGTVAGLEGTGLVLQNNGGDDLPISANGSFTFSAELADLSEYAVTVATQPGAPIQTCTVANGAGTLAGNDVDDIQVQCVTEPSELDLSLSALDFGILPGGEQGSAVIVLTSAGTGELEIIQVSDPSAPFNLSGGSCLAVPLLLQPGESCDIEVVFAPAASDQGLFESSISIVSNAASSPDTVDLRGSSAATFAIPTLGPLGLALMALLLGGLAWRQHQGRGIRRA